MCTRVYGKWVILEIEMADFPFLLHPGVLFVVPKEEHLMMVLFSSYGYLKKYRVAGRVRVPTGHCKKPQYAILKSLDLQLYPKFFALSPVVPFKWVCGQ